MFSASSKTCRSTAAKSAGIRLFRSPATSLAKRPRRNWPWRCSIASLPGKTAAIRGSKEDAMAERAPFLSTAHGAYHHRERPADDEELTRVGPGTPCGEYLRRFWEPVVLSGGVWHLARPLCPRGGG